MPRLTFVEFDGQTREVDARLGETVMRSARNAGVEGIIAECGGSMTCLTCHCYVTLPESGSLPEPSANEQEMLDCVLEARENSRLSCQVVVTPELDGARFDIPQWQG
ncbi:2Fe-2S iron-sulfur cluster-binding protein [Novosphingobium fluoreni]|uniref:2Fe-2S iron-sulfur cluster-binding protein n=1 Tax=Novosphingobium fluoreni TaxID=1391222 RepID=UPI0009E9F82A|nr:2Fe-2S iron-sulfur cluster-binding protein [Novosphingobium fluoreni]